MEAGGERSAEAEAEAIHIAISHLEIPPGIFEDDIAEAAILEDIAVELDGNANKTLVRMVHCCTSDCAAGSPSGG
jgi:hypothetical protein